MTNTLTCQKHQREMTQTLVVHLLKHTYELFKEIIMQDKGESLNTRNKIYKKCRH